MIKKNILFFLTFFFVLSLFFYIFYLSTNYIINYWTFSQAHINYSEGFVKRGLFGTIALFLENRFNIKFVNTFNIFFILIYLTNILIFFILIKKYSHFKFIFLFFALSPVLILFSFNDLGGYQRFDALSIFLILLHTFCVSLYRSNKINFKKYLNIFKYFFIPLISLSLLIHEIQMWSIPFHFFLIKMILRERKIKSLYLYAYFFIPVIISLIIFLFPINEEIIISMFEKLPNNKNLWQYPIVVAASAKGNFDILLIELNRNLLNIYNLKINIFFLILSVLPINILLYYFCKKNIIQVLEKSNFIYFYLSIIPYLVFFVIGDTGRWIHLIAITSFSFLSQYPVLKEQKKTTMIKHSFLKVSIFIILMVYCFFIRLPHGGNFEEKKITIWGGINEKFLSFYKVYFSSGSEDKYNLNKRFQKAK